MPNASIICASQIVRDHKLPPTEALIGVGTELSRFCRDHELGAGKLAADVLIARLDRDGVAEIEMVLTTTGDIRMSIRQRWPLRLIGYDGPLDPENVLAAVPGASTGCGGGATNVGSNLVLFGAALRALPESPSTISLALAASGPALASLPPEVRRAADGFVSEVDLSMGSRRAVHMPLSRVDPATLLVVSRPEPVAPKIEERLSRDPRLREALATADVVVSGDSLWDVFRRAGLPVSDKTFLINPATALRDPAANEAFGRGVILPVNAHEAPRACDIYLRRARRGAPDIHGAPVFASPFANGGFSRAAFRELDHSLGLLLSLNPPAGRVGRDVYGCPVTFGAGGGVVVSSGDDDLACFTGVPDPDGARVLAGYADPDRVHTDSRPTDAGAGDGDATITALANAVDPRDFIRRHARAGIAEKEIRLAALVFVGVLGRLTSALILMTTDTFMPIQPQRLATLLDDVARSVVIALRKAMASRGGDSFRVEPWGIDVAVWRLKRSPKGELRRRRGGADDAAIERESRT
jgi:hypothetical protein